MEFSGDTYWFISNRVGDSSYYVALFTANAACPDGKNYALSKMMPSFTLFVYLTYLIFQIVPYIWLKLVLVLMTIQQPQILLSPLLKNKVLGDLMLKDQIKIENHF